jgi:hypothetical protein
MVTLPSIVKHLFPKHVINQILVCIVRTLYWIAKSFLISFERIMTPETVVECEDSVLSRGIKNGGGGSIHLDAAFGIAIHLPLVEGPNSDSDFDTHLIDYKDY